jgi:hypothetical protein
MLTSSAAAFKPAFSCPNYVDEVGPATRESERLARAVLWFQTQRPECSRLFEGV